MSHFIAVIEYTRQQNGFGRGKGRDTICLNIKGDYNLHSARREAYYQADADRLLKPFVKQVFEFGSIAHQEFSRNN